MYGQLMAGASSLFIVGSLPSYWSVHYQRFYCIHVIAICDTNMQYVIPNEPALLWLM